MAPSIKVDHNKISISGLCGETIPISKIEKIELLETIPRISLRTNGFALAYIRKGYFQIEGMGRVKVFMQATEGPFLTIETTEGKYIINAQDSIEIVNLYRDIILHKDKNQAAT